MVLQKPNLFRNSTLHLNCFGCFWPRLAADYKIYTMFRGNMMKYSQATRPFPRMAQEEIKKELKFRKKRYLDYKAPTAFKSKIQGAGSSATKSSHIQRIRYHPIPLLIGGTSLIYCVAYITYIGIELSRPSVKPVHFEASKQADVSCRYNSIATTFDETVDSNEYWLGLSSLRKELVSQAQGNVLEVSIGTGRNLSYYDWNIKSSHLDNNSQVKTGKAHGTEGKVKSFTAIDTSFEMLQIAHDKLEALIPGNKNVRWVLGDAAVRDTIPHLPETTSVRGKLQLNKYDTIVQTMGLCSVKDPVALLRNLGEHIKEEEGRILLLEHGRGRWKWLNALLDKTAENHAHKFGCWWNRDIRQIIEDSGLEVVIIMTPKWWHGGTTWWVELKKSKSNSH